MYVFNNDNFFMRIIFYDDHLTFQLLKSGDKDLLILKKCRLSKGLCPIAAGKKNIFFIYLFDNEL